MKKGLIIKLVIIIFLLIIFLIVDYNFITLEVVQNDIVIEVNSDYILEEVRGTYNGKDITDKIEVTNTIDKYNVGEYIVEYKGFGYVMSKSFILNVKVVDSQPPILKLKGTSFQPVNNNYKELGYIVSDNYYSENEIDVTIQSDVNFNFIDGVNTIEYKAIDKSGNVSYQYRDVYYDPEYENTDFTAENFVMPNISSIATKNELAITMEELKNNYLFVGDSIIRDMGYNGILPGESVAAYPCLGPNNLVGTVCTYYNDENNWRDVPTIVLEEQPKFIIINFGLCALEIDSFKDTLDNFQKTINLLSWYSKDTKISIVSILPTLNNDVGNKPSNETINTFNYYLARLCESNQIPFINVATVLKSENGYGNEDYYFNDGYHLNVEGEKVYYDYIVNHLNK